MVVPGHGVLYTWGYGYKGQLGRSTHNAMPASVDLEGQRVVDVACGNNHTLVLTAPEPSTQRLWQFGQMLGENIIRPQEVAWYVYISSLPR